MHWFWRATIAVVIGALCGNFFLLFMNLLGGFPYLGKWDRWFKIDGTLCGTVVPGTAALFAVAAFVCLTSLFPFKQKQDNETRCRKCAYILRGITEPRCPECGEII